ncbi:hypothetical protein P0Y35_18550 [Kiritimatiellaeota bacterium B1221]|nr:hypothetical protein [Kiritimatiellaeota bacterium B1221]
MGNGVASQAIANYGLQVNQYIIINGAIALEAYDADQTDNFNNDTDMARNMTEDDWKPFYDYKNADDEHSERRLLASNWHERFDSTDDRSKLTWKNIFASNELLSVAYNFYSQGDEIVENADNTEEFGHWDNIWEDTLTGGGRHAWVQQEIGKGGQNTIIFNRGFHDANGGWEFNDGEDGYRKPAFLIGWKPFSPEQAKNEITDEELKTKPFHRRLLFPLLYDPELGHGVARDLIDFSTIMGSGIPAMSYAIAVNPLEELEEQERNFNMQAELKSEEAKTDWPVKFPDYAFDWLHNDFKNVAIQYIHPMYQKIIDLGELNKD